MRRLCLPMAIVVFSSAILGVVLLLNTDTAHQGDAMEATDPLEGAWRSTVSEIHGRTVETTLIVLTFRDGTCTTDNGDGEPAQATYRIDKSHKPPYLERVVTTGPSKGQTSRLLYKVEGDTLKLAMGEDVEQFPQGFNDQGVVVTTFKRLK